MFVLELLTPFLRPTYPNASHTASIVEALSVVANGEIEKVNRTVDKIAALKVHASLLAHAWGWLG